MSKYKSLLSAPSVLLFPPGDRKAPLKYKGKMDYKPISEFVSAHVPDSFLTLIADAGELTGFLAPPQAASWSEWFASFASSKNDPPPVSVVFFTSGDSTIARGLSAAFADSLRFALVDTKKTPTAQLEALKARLRVTSVPAVRLMHTLAHPTGRGTKEGDYKAAPATWVHLYAHDLKYDELRKYFKDVERQVEDCQTETSRQFQFFFNIPLWLS